MNGEQIIDWCVFSFSISDTAFQLNAVIDGVSLTASGVLL